MQYQQALFGICVNKGHTLNAVISETGVFSVNIPP
jgi:flavin reductase (DIM6/NTAB) family NADH-FMN oxidoreductase RutF